MGRYLNPGNENFIQAVRSQIYIDKTKLIAYTNRVLRTAQKYICVSRPRRFGKSMAADMLSAYYGCGADSRELFKVFKISEDSSFEENLNRYHVIFLNIQDFVSKSSEINKIKSQIEKLLIRELKRNYPKIEYLDSEDLVEILQDIYLETSIPFVFIIDEWDCIFRVFKTSTEAQIQYLDFLRNLLKDRSYVSLAYMTGILPVKKYGTHSALNMFDEFSMTEPDNLAEFVGFTQNEVKTLCKQHKMEFAEIKKWYDGYRLNDIHIYNPKSVVDAMLKKTCKSYWTKTETYEALKIYIDANLDGLKDAIVTMLGNGCVKIDTRKFQNDMTTIRTKDDVLTLLVHLGYLAFNENKSEVFLPNLEIEEEFHHAMDEVDWSPVVNALKKSEQLLKVTIEKNQELVALFIDEIHTEVTSILNYNNENSLSCVISIAYYSAKKEYWLVRELPTGNGFADIIFIPRKHSNKPALIVELKWDKTAEGAIAQIKDKKYIQALDEYKGNILLVGINYDKNKKIHQCLIEECKLFRTKNKY